MEILSIITKESVIRTNSPFIFVGEVGGLIVRVTH